MSLRRISVVLQKEVVDNLRDRRSLLAALFYPLLGPVLLVGLLLVVGRTLGERADEALTLPVIGLEHAPDLGDFLRTQGLEIEEDPAGWLPSDLWPPAGASPTPTSATTTAATGQIRSASGATPTTSGGGAPAGGSGPSATDGTSDAADARETALESAASEAVRRGDVDVVLVVPPGYRDELAGGRPAAVRLIVDQSRTAAQVDVGRARRAIGGYGRLLAAQRLLVRGIDPSLITPITVEERNVSTPQSQAAQLLNLMPYFLIFSVFIGGMYLAIDSTAGERERGSLEPLLINPIARWELVMGKLGATVLFTLVSVLETLLAFLLLLSVLPLEQALGVRLEVEPMAFVVIFGITAPMILLAVPLQFIIATFTRSFKEAQNYLSFLPLIPALPGTFLAFVPVRPTLWSMAIPTFGQQILINQIMRGESIRAIHVAVSLATTVGVGAVLVWIAVRLYARERILYGTGGG